jgi:hypothetical protein
VLKVAPLERVTSLIRNVSKQKRRGRLMDPWKLFSELCRLVVEEQNVYLEITILGGHIQMALWPYNEEGFDEDND